MKTSQILTEQDAPVKERYPNRFKQGQSGNPGGRPKKTAAELKAVEKMKKLTPEAVDVVVSILKNEKASFYARLQAAEIIFNRAMGRPETYLKVDNAEQSVEASVARLQSLFESDEDEEEVARRAADAEEETDPADPDSDETDDPDEDPDAVTEEVHADAG